MIVPALMMSATHAAASNRPPVWFLVGLGVAVFAFIVWGFFALAALEREQ